MKNYSPITNNKDIITKEYLEGQLSPVSADVQANATAIGNLVKLPKPEASDAGKVVSIGNNADIIYSDMPTGLPDVTVADAGKFLRVSDAGNWIAEIIPRAEDLSV